MRVQGRRLLGTGSPAYAGIDLTIKRPSLPLVRFPRLRGDRPSSSSSTDGCPTVPPPTRG